jgi:hypothetical protein
MTQKGGATGLGSPIHCRLGIKVGIHRCRPYVSEHHHTLYAGASTSWVTLAVWRCMGLLSWTWCQGLGRWAPCGLCARWRPHSWTHLQVGWELGEPSWVS